MEVGERNEQLSRQPNRFAQQLFDGLPARYDLLAELLSFGQNGRWRQAMVDAVAAASPASVLDVATGPAGVALQLARRTGARVTGVDLTEQMLRAGVANVARSAQAGRVDLLLARGEQLPFPDETFDALTFTYLLRYVSSPADTLKELVRVVKPGGLIANLEFHVPTGKLWHPLWLLYTRVGLPAAGFLLGGREWYEVGRFLGPSISEHYRRYPVQWHVRAWEQAGVEAVQVRLMSVGGGLVMWGRKGSSGPAPAPAPAWPASPRKWRPVPEQPGPRRDDGAASASAAARPAWYAASPGRWRDWLTILHPPYTAWHLSYVLIGAALAPAFHLERLIATLIAFGLAVGIGAHGLDELRGRPLHTSISSGALTTVSVASIAGAVVIGALGIAQVGWGLAIFIAVGVVLVVAYNMELWHGRLHNDTTFALAWGSFPLLTAYYAQSSTLRPAAVAGAAFAYGLSRAQRVLSSDARDLRRRTVSVEGDRVDVDGSRRALTRDSLLRPLERSLVALSWSTCLLGVGLVLARTGH